MYGPTVAIGESHPRDWPRVRELMWCAHQRALSWGVLVLAASCCFACQPTVNVGQWTCPASTANASTTDASTTDASSMPSADDPITLPWSTGFENRFCDYAQPSGFCTMPVQYSLVTSPVKSGHFAMAFDVVGEDGGAFQQSRCVRQGVLPVEAYYGAWYYIPATATNHHLWNLIHFQGMNSPGSWDVSLVNAADGALNLRVLNFLWTGPPADHLLDGPPVPIGSWFHIEFYLRRAKDATGEAALYQDGVRVIDFANVITEDTDFSQWYVGNLADALSPPASTLYVDDVTIASTLGWTPPP
jgi:hypothetical protein